MKVTDPISSPSQHVVQTKNPRMENLRNQKWETSYKKATSTCHFILRQIRSHSLCFPRHECRIWVLWDWVACFPCPRCIFIRRNFRTGNFNTNRSIITGDVKYGIKIPNVSCFLFIILASGHQVESRDLTSKKVYSRATATVRNRIFSSFQNLIRPLVPTICISRIFDISMTWGQVKLLTSPLWVNGGNIEILPNASVRCNSFRIMCS